MEKLHIKSKQKQSSFNRTQHSKYLNQLSCLSRKKKKNIHVQNISNQNINEKISVPKDNIFLLRISYYFILKIISQRQIASERIQNIINAITNSIVKNQVQIISRFIKSIQIPFLPKGRILSYWNAIKSYLKQKKCELSVLLNLVPQTDNLLSITFELMLIELNPKNIQYKNIIELFSILGFNSYAISHKKIIIENSIILIDFEDKAINFIILKSKVQNILNSRLQLLHFVDQTAQSRQYHTCESIVESNIQENYTIFSIDSLHQNIHFDSNEKKKILIVQKKNQKCIKLIQSKVIIIIQNYLKNFHLKNYQQKFSSNKVLHSKINIQLKILDIILLKIKKISIKNNKDQIYKKNKQLLHKIHIQTNNLQSNL